LARFLASTLSGPVLEMSTQAKNYVFFSLFRTGDRTILGICHRFIPLPSVSYTHLTLPTKRIV